MFTFEKVYDKTFNLFGAEIHIRIEPIAFKQCIRLAERNITATAHGADCTFSIRLYIDEAIKLSSHLDPEIIRLKTFADFMLGDS